MVLCLSCIVPDTEHAAHHTHCSHILYGHVRPFLLLRSLLVSYFEHSTHNCYYCNLYVCQRKQKNINVDHPQTTNDSTRQQLQQSACAHTRCLVHTRLPTYIYCTTTTTTPMPTCTCLRTGERTTHGTGSAVSTDLDAFFETGRWRSVLKRFRCSRMRGIHRKTFLNVVLAARDVGCASFT